MSTEESTSQGKHPSKYAVMRFNHIPMEVAFSLDVPWVLPSCLSAEEGKWSECSGILSITREQDRVDVAVEGRYSVQCTCDICGQPITWTNSIHTTLLYRPSTIDPRQTKGKQIPKTVKDLDRISHQVTLEEDDLDVGWYDNGELDLTLILTEAIVLDRPTVLGCHDEGVTPSATSTCSV